jgi:hypothetical protein
MHNSRYYAGMIKSPARRAQTSHLPHGFHPQEALTITFSNCGPLSGIFSQAFGQ